jgi:hypothetical protein
MSKYEAPSMARDTGTGPEETTMTPTTKQASAACVTAAVLIVSSELLRLAVGLLSGSNSAATLVHTLTYGLALAGMYALLLALTGLFVRNRDALGGLGLVGYLTASAGTVLVAGDWWFEAFAVPMIDAAAPEVLDLPPGGSLVAGAVITAALFAAGWIMFGVAAFRSGAFSRPAAALLVFGGACGVLTLSTPYQIPLALAVGWIGTGLRRQPQQVVPVQRIAVAPSR